MIENSLTWFYILVYILIHRPDFFVVVYKIWGEKSARTYQQLHLSTAVCRSLIATAQKEQPSSTLTYQQT